MRSRYRAAVQFHLSVQCRQGGGRQARRQGVERGQQAWADPAGSGPPQHRDTVLGRLQAHGLAAAGLGS